jgi:hypothetical protein
MKATQKDDEGARLDFEQAAALGSSFAAQGIKDYYY